MITTQTVLKHYDAIQAEIEAGALFVVNHSGGKDSQAQYAVIKSLVPADQIVVLHADLGTVEWDGVQDHIRSNVDQVVNVVHAIDKDGNDKTFLGMVRGRGMFPGASTRQCTSDLKRGPCEKFIRHELKRRGLKRVVSCFGFRAQESSARAKRPTWAVNKKNSVAGRTWIDFTPIHDITVEEVFAIIKAAGQEPHWAYAAGMTRLSCCFCILASKGDLQTAARINPDLFKVYVDLEKEIGHTLQPAGSLEEITGIAA